MQEKFGDQITYMIASVSWRLETELKAETGAGSLPPEQWRILSLLHERNGRSMSDLAQDVLVEAPTLTKIIDRMIADALVYRAPDPGDRRRVLIFVSERGSSRWEASRPIHRALENQLVRRLGQDRIATLRQLLRDMMEPDPDPKSRKEPASGRAERGADRAAPPQGGGCRTFDLTVDGFVQINAGTLRGNASRDR